MATAKQQRLNSNWEGMLKRWSVEQGKHHRVLSSQNVYNHPALAGGPYYCSDPQWRGKTKEYYMIHEQPKYYDIGDRVYDISCGFPMIEEKDEDVYEDEVMKKKESKYEMKMNEGYLDDLDELQAYVEFIDVAEVLHSEDRLFSFIRNVLSYKHAAIRAKAAEVITAMVQKNRTSQQLVIKENGLKFLLKNFTSDPDETSRTKALGAISSLIQNNQSGLIAFQRKKGYAALRKALISGSVCQREVVKLIEYLLRENNLYSQELNLSSCDDAEVRGAALKGLLMLARRKGGSLCQQFKLHLSTCCCSYHRSKQFKLHLHTVKRRKEKKKQLALIRNNKSGITAFRREKGYAALRKALISGSVCQSGVVNLIEYLRHENNLYSQELNLASNDDAEVREAAISGLRLLARKKCKNSGQLIKNDDKLKQVKQPLLLFPLFKAIQAPHSHC